MEYKTLNQIRAVADIRPGWLGARPLSKQERLERWAEVLERQEGRRLRTLFEIEYAAPAAWSMLRADGSPLSIAFADQRLRSEGLCGDTIGDAIAFFGISDWELHNILCFCHHGETMSADVAAVRVRAAAARAAGHQSAFIRPMVLGGCVATLVAIGTMIS